MEPEELVPFYFYTSIEEECDKCRIMVNSIVSGSEFIVDEIRGTILRVGKFLGREQTKIDVKISDLYFPIKLAEDRKYIIPDYQREIRWGKEQLIELIRDIRAGRKFLGNVILHRRSDTEYELIDGQQRITALLMILQFIRSRFGQSLDVFDTCKLEIHNFAGFAFLFKANFNKNKLTTEKIKLIEETDFFNQENRYSSLWQQLESMDEFKDKSSCEKMLENIEGSIINVIVNTEADSEVSKISIRYFLDVNLKGVRLDTEDIFKGYLFSKDSSKEIREEWKNLKKLTYILEKISRQDDYYPITKLLEHYFLCELYKNEKYKEIVFKENFTITREVQIEDGGKFHKGTHLIEVINDKHYMLQCIRNLNNYLEIIIDIINTTSPSAKFQNLFNPYPNEKIDYDEKQVIHRLISNILKDKYIVPRILVMKYILETIADNRVKGKEEYRKIYGINLLAVLFTIFEGDKNIKKILNVVKDSNWYQRAVDQSIDYFSAGEIPKNRIKAQYKILHQDDKEDYKYRCKSLATIYNFYEIREKDGWKYVKVKNLSNMKSFITDGDKFSIEHFIINDNENYKIGEETRKYPRVVAKYANTIFNFIFINENLNDELSNFTLPKKIEIIRKKLQINPSLIECDFSKMILECCISELMPSLDFSLENTEKSIDFMESYYKNEFIDEFNKYAIKVFNKIGKKMTEKLQES